MKITLIKDASWGGKNGKAGASHTVDDRVAQKLIDRGYAKSYVKEEKAEEDGTATSE
jgi:hypothetical protein|tara:strand:+ start:443 stop:613 length:171 start_codon:yes stop_codon:yes gene_type:complete